MDELLTFRIGDTVYIIDHRSPYFSQEGRVLARLIGKHAHVPDEYDVVFADGRSARFGAGQLDKAQHF
jgi:hypothetical protein